MEPGILQQIKRSTDIFSPFQSPDLSPIDSNLCQLTTIGPDFECWNPAMPWMSEEEANTILTDPAASEKPAKMALHFLLSSISSSTTQAVGYIETYSVTAQLLKALLYRIISIINQIANRIPPNTSP